MQENLHHRLPEPKMGEVAGKGPQLVSPKEMLLSFCAVKQLMNLALGEGCLLCGVLGPTGLLMGFWGGYLVQI